MNRLEEKLGRECTDRDFDVQQILLERTQKRVRELEATIWAIARAAPNHTVSFYSGHLIDAPDGALKMWRNEADMTINIRATAAEEG